MAVGSIKEKVTLVGKINTDNKIKGSFDLGVVNITPRIQEKTTTPTTTIQEIVYDTGYTGLSKVTVNAVTKDIDSNIIASNIKKDVEILGVKGTLDGYLLSIDNDELIFNNNAKVEESELIL